MNNLPSLSIVLAFKAQKPLHFVRIKSNESFSQKVCMQKISQFWALSSAHSSLLPLTVPAICSQKYGGIK